MKVYKSKYLQLNYYENDNYIEMIWLAETLYMTKDEYKEEFRNYIDIIDKHRPQAVLPNTLNMQFTIDPETQEWTNENVFIFSLSIGLDKAAFVVSEDVISQLSIEQTMEEAEGQKFKTQYFTDEKEAKNWILTELSSQNPIKPN